MKAAKAIDDSEALPASSPPTPRFLMEKTPDDHWSGSGLWEKVPPVFLPTNSSPAGSTSPIIPTAGFYEGQLRLGLPVSRELIKTQEEIRAIAAGKLALTLYHIILRVRASASPGTKSNISSSPSLRPAISA
jgi:hypothetical protein